MRSSVAMSFFCRAWFLSSSTLRISSVALSGGAALLAVRHAITKKPRTDRATAIICRRFILSLPFSGLDMIFIEGILQLCLIVIACARRKRQDEAAEFGTA